MLGARIVIHRGQAGEAERPFWISFADLMTALMVLFLLVMSVALLAVTKTISEAEQQRTERDSDIEELLTELERAATQFPGIKVDKIRNAIDFGDRARFDTASSRLTPEQATLLRAFVPKVLAVARADQGKRWLKRIVVEGFADVRGTYLFNLNLSLQRSERVLCTLLSDPGDNASPLTPSELAQVRDLFLVGGYSFNSAKTTFEESRRIELRLEFLGVDERPVSVQAPTTANFGSCALT